MTKSEGDEQLINFCNSLNTLEHDQLDIKACLNALYVTTIPSKKRVRVERRDGSIGREQHLKINDPNEENELG